MESYYQPSKMSAYDAIFEAQKIALAPFAFQTAKSLLELDILKSIDAAAEEGMSIENLSHNLHLSKYGLSVLLDMGLSMGIVWFDKTTKHFHLNKVGHYLLHDKMTQVNLNFTADVNYLGLAQLTKAIQENYPAGLSQFSDTEKTIYPILSKLPKAAKKSWFDFDHFYSDNSFEDVLKEIFQFKPKKIVDIGCNTGKWAKQVLNYNEEVRMALIDLEPQIEQTRENLLQVNKADRVDFFPRNVLEDSLPSLPDADVVFMSQFLDCFSEEQIIQILQKVSQSMPKAKIAILEIFWDQQKHETASYVLNATSLYFTVIANGNSRFYAFSEFKNLIRKAGLKLSTQVNHIAIGGHSLLILERQ